LDSQILRMVSINDISDHMAYVNNYMIKRFSRAWNDDLLGDTAMRCVVRFHQFRGISIVELRCWMVRIARNVMIDSIRRSTSKRAGYAVLSLDNLRKGWGEPSRTTNPAGLVDLERAMLRLKKERPKYHEALVAYGLVNGSNSERVRVFRAIRYLRLYMGVIK
jgi:DNA-directed RNA polymerase specialized sigma24 family protein